MVPEGWKKAPLKALLEGHSPGYWGSPADGNGAGVPVLRSTNFRDDGFLDLTDVAYRDVPREKIEQKRLRKGDLLLESSGGGPNKPVGRVVMVDGDLDGDYLYTNFLRRLRPRGDQADARFLLYLLWNLHRTGGTKVFQHQTTGIRNLNYKEYLRWELSIPPLLEQRKIAAILSSVDDAIASTRKLIVQAKRVKQGILQTLMTRGIGHTQFKRTETGEIPDAWELVALGDVCAHITKGATPTTYGYQWIEESDEGVLFLRSECVSEDGFRLTGSERIPEAAHASMSRSEIRAGDVLVTITGNVGRVGQVPKKIERANINQHLARVRVERSGLLQDFVHFALQVKQQRDRFETIVTGLAYPQLSLKQIRQTAVPVPSLGEQEAILARIGAVQDVVALSEASIKAWQKIKRGLMQDLLTGRVRVQSD